MTTPEAKGIIHSDFENSLGVYGFSGTKAATEYIENEKLDCILILGTSLGESATRNYNEILVKDKTVIHVDTDRAELNKVFKADIAIHNSVENVLNILKYECEQKQNNLTISREYDEEYICNHTGISTRLFLEKLPSIMTSRYHLMSDIGEFMNFVIKDLRVSENTGFSISLNYGAMGVAIGGAVGTALANKNSITGIIVGDGSFFMNGTEILTAKEYKLPIVYFVINNSMLGYVEHGQGFIYGRSIHGVKQERVSISDIAKSMGVKSLQINSLDELGNCKEAINSLNGPLVVEIVTDGTEVPIAADRFKALKSGK